MVNFREIEEKWQNAWEKEKIFEANPNKQEKFFITWPYPYTSGPFHIGHGRTVTIVDVIARFKRMQGYNVLFPLGFHVTGTPVLAISTKLKNNDWKTLQLYKEYISLHTKDEKRINEILASFVDPYNVMQYFANTFKTDLISIGCSIDWRRSFTTTDPEYNKFVEWQFKKLKEAGYLKKGEYPILFCVECNNAVGEDDIKSGDTIKPRVEEFYILKFKCKDAYLVPATLRPETIFGVTNLWINPKADYVKIKIGKEKWILSKEAAKKLKYQNKEFEIIERFKGKKLVGKKCTEPINKRKVPILEAGFVDPNEATGVVYSVPAHAPYDYIALRDLGENIELISIIRVEGFGEFPAKEIVEKYEIRNQKEKEKLDKVTEELYKEEFYTGVMKRNCGKYEGKKISEIKEKIVQDFKKSGILEVFYEASALEKPIKCRCGGDVVVAVLKDQWFIDYGNGKWKEKTKECLKNVKIIPEKYRKQFEDAISWVHERPCARRRGLGTRLPFDENWIIESLSDSTIYMAFYTVIHKIRKNKIKAEQLTQEFWDYVLLGKGNLEKVSKDLGIDKRLILELRSEFEYWYPVDLRHTGTPHIPNHLIFYLFNHVAVFPKKHWPKAISLNEFIIREGKKMSKSLGNVIPLVEISRKYSADLYRLYMIYAADLDTTLDWREKDIESIKAKMLYFVELISKIIKSKKDSESEIKKWFATRFYKNLIDATEKLENFELRDYAQIAFYNVLNDINYYKRRGGELGALKEFLQDWLKILTPVIPHICEEFWKKLGNDNFISLEKWPAAKKKLINEIYEKKEELIKNLLEDLNSIIKLVGKKPKKIKLFIADNWKYKLITLLVELRDKGKIKESMKKAMSISEIREHGSDASKLINKYIKDPSKIPNEILERKIELEALEGAKEFFKKEFGAEIEIINESETKEAKAKQALPGKPAILVE